MIIHEGQTLKLNLLCCSEVFVETHIGSGGYGDVYKVRDIKTGRYYAFKHIRIKNKKHTEKVIDCAFRLGKKASMTFDSPYIVKNYGLVKLDELSFGLLSEFVDGEDLREWSIKNPSIFWEERIEVFIKIMEGVKKIHQKGVIHHDLKPQNILITKDNTPKILDFGLSKVIDKDISSINELKGTPAYIAPENFIGIRTTRQFDIFSLGSILYEMYRGKDYFKICGYEDMPPLGRMIENQGFTAGNLLDLDPHFPIESELDKWICKIIKKATAFNPANRYKNIDQFLEDIYPQAASRPPSISNNPPSKKESTPPFISPNPTSGNQTSFKIPFAISLTLFFLLFILIIITFNSNKEMKQQIARISEKNEKSKKELSVYKRLYGMEKQGRIKEETRYNKLKRNIDSTGFTVGARMSSVTGGGYDSRYKMFFYVYKPILLKSVHVAAQSTGSIKIILYDMSNKIIQESGYIELSKPKAWQKINLNFRVNKGRYYLAFSGSIGIYYHSENLGYPYKIEDIIEITGSDSGNNYDRQNYYQYFYEWEIALVFD